MHEGIANRVMTVPGEYFDVNPNRERTGTSPWIRLSASAFGPPRQNLEAGLSRLAEMVKKHKR
jgi:DNA-binding transcriptional MocR family regulator